MLAPFLGYYSVVAYHEITSIKTEETLISKPEIKAYAIQLSATKSLEGANNFIMENDLDLISSQVEEVGGLYRVFYFVSLNSELANRYTKTANERFLESYIEELTVEKKDIYLTIPKKINEGEIQQFLMDLYSFLENSTPQNIDKNILVDLIKRDVTEIEHFESIKDKLEELDSIEGQVTDEQFMKISNELFRIILEL
jgi:hypothetical protein